MIFNLQTCSFYKDVVNFDLHGKKGVTAVTLGTGSYIAGAELGISDDGDSHLLIGNYTAIAHNTCFEIGINHDYERFSTYPFDAIANKKDEWKIADGYIPVLGKRNPKQIIIGHDVWMGANVTVMGGVRIGNGAVIGAGAVVAKNIPPYAIAVGNPVRVVKYRFPADIIQKFQQLKWWNWSEEKIKEALPLLNDVENFLKKYYCEPRTETKSLLAQEIETLHSKYEILHLCPDIHSTEQVWRKFIRKYIERENIQKILLLWLDDSPESAQAASEIKVMLDKAGESAPQIMTYQGGDDIMRSIIENMDVIITTKEFKSLKILDSLQRNNVKILFANDY